jgi:flagellar operon protein (TIGR03826 family)
MPGLKNCIRCGKLFVYTGNALCGQCIEQDERTYKQVKEYLEQNSRSTTVEVAAALGLPVDRILQYLREGKLELSSENANIILACERCGRSITKGRFCSDCALLLKKEFSKGNQGYRAGAGKGKERMYTAQWRKK